MKMIWAVIRSDKVVSVARALQSIGVPKVAPETKELELVLKDIAGVKERSFRWKLSQ